MKYIFFILLIAVFAGVSFAQPLNSPIAAPPNIILNAVPAATNTISRPSGYNQNGNSAPTLFNYNRTFTPQVPISDPSLINENSDAASVSQASTYFDGWGRPVELIQKYANGFFKHTVTPYDNRIAPVQYSFLPFASSTNNGGKFQLDVFNDQKNFYDNLYPSEPGMAVRATNYYSDVSSGKSFQQELPPGNSGVGQGKGTENTISFNAFTEVYMIVFDDNTLKPKHTGYYLPYTLTKKITGNSDGARIEEFFDKSGKIILRRQLLEYYSCSGDGSSNSGGNSNGIIQPPPAALCSKFAETYYVYDGFGRLRDVISPKGFQKVIANNWVFSVSILDNLCDYFNYDDKNRLIERHTAGQHGSELYVYDRKDRIVLTKTPGMAGWKFCIYDKYDRVIVTGICNISRSRADWQTLVENGPMLVSSSDLEYYIVYDANEGKYPTTLSSCEILEFFYYDKYDLSIPIFTISGISFDANEFNGNILSGPSALSPIVSFNVNGILVGKKVKTIRPNGYSDPTLQDWQNIVYYYDKNNNLIQTRQTNVRSGLNISSSQYDFKGRCLRNIYRQSNAVCANKTGFTTIITDFTYIPRSFQLSKVLQNIDNKGWRDIAQYAYNDLGQVSVKNIGGVEVQNYEYNLRGQLISINRAYTENSMVSDPKITFGETLKYDYGFSNPLVNGNVSGIVWRGPGTSFPKSYAYTYNNGGSLIQADYAEYYKISSPGGGGTANWNSNVSNYTESNIVYDLNGNIEKLKRYGATVKPLGGIGNGIIDDLTYTYANGGESNELLSVQDNVPTAGQITDYDFKDKGNTSVDYTYDANGNLASDDNKKIITVNNTYLNKPESISFNNGDKIQYVYDAEGNKLVEDYSGNSIKRIDYLDAITYQDNALLSIQNSEGYAKYNNTNYAYYFFAKDHLQNVRTVVDGNIANNETNPSGSQPVKVKLGFEPVDAATEKDAADIIDGVRDLKPSSTCPNDLYAALLDANDPSKRIGGLIMMKVMAGDSFNVNAQAYHQCHIEQSGTVSPEEMLSSILTASNGGGQVGGEGGNVQFIQNVFNTNSFVNSFQLVKSSQADPAKPGSYLNYMLFDENFNIVEDESGIIQMPAGEALWQNLDLGGPREIGQSGYLVVYVSNEDKRLTAYWDRISLTLYKGRLVDENHYYPYGLTINLSTSNPLPNRNLFLTNKLEKANDLHWYDCHARQYDPQLGRFNSVDPLKQYHGANIYCGGNPVAKSDKSGLSDYWSNYPNTGSATAMYALFNGMGISGGGSFGFVMSDEAIRSGYKAYEKFLGAATMAGVGFVLGETIMGTRVLTSAEAAALESEAAAAASNSYSKALAESASRQAMFEANDAYLQSSLEHSSLSLEYQTLNLKSLYREGRTITELAYEANHAINPQSAKEALARLGSESGIAEVRTASELARMAQGSGRYPGVDIWRDITLKDGQYVLGGVPGQSNFYTTLSGFNRVRDIDALWNGLQVEKFDGVFRSEMGLYQVQGNIPAAFGSAYANPLHGVGGLPQIFIPEYGNLSLLKTLFLR